MNHGFSLITTLMFVLLTTPVLFFVHLRILTHWRMADNVESQLHSMVAAQNGIEYARTLLPHTDLNALLTGPDGRLCGPRPLEWRNPMTFREALSILPGAWEPACDDGIPSYRGQRLLLPNESAEVSGSFFVRFSNNPEEPPDRDEDYVVLARSMGVVPQQMRDLFFPWITNSVSLIEARFRQERSFFLPSPLTLLASSGSFDFQGDLFMIEGENQYAVSIVSWAKSQLLEDLLGSLSGSQHTRFRGQGTAPSIRDASLIYKTHSTYKRLLSSGFWSHFLEQLSYFADDSDQGIGFLPTGGAIESSFRGVLVARGDVLLRKSARIDGLLLHLGEGTLVLQDQARIVGGVWMSNLDSKGAALKSRSISLHVSGSSEIQYQEELIREALAFLPPTQLGWRILFPELTQ